MKTKLSVLLFFLIVLVSPQYSYSSFVVGAKGDSASVVAPITSEDAAKKALEEFKSLSKKEKKSRLKEMKKVWKQYKADKKAGNDVSTNTIVLVLLAILIPPLAVYLYEGQITNRFWISVLLTILGYVLFGFAGILFLGSLPGIIYSLIVVLGNK